MKKLAFGALGLLLTACGGSGGEYSDAIIYPGKVITMNGEGSVAEAVVVQGDMIIGAGRLKTMKKDFRGATVDETFADKVILPGFIDPHAHVTLGAMLYSFPMVAPWPMATPDGMKEGYGTPEAFRAAVTDIVATAPGDGPIVIYGYHNLVHGDVDRHLLSALSPERPLILWHFSGHDFYLNNAALAQANLAPALAETYHGVDLDDHGDLTGRIYEDAAFVVLQAFHETFLSPEHLVAGFEAYREILAKSGVTTTADLAYGVFGLQLEDQAIRATWQNMEHAGFRMYLVPEYRMLQREFGDGRVKAVLDMYRGAIPAAAPVLPRVKFFTDAAYYSQTMRLSDPGYLAGQSEGTHGLWVIPPEELVPTMQPYWDAGLGINIHSNGDAAQTATLDALEALGKTLADNTFTIEHGGLFSPEQVARAGELGAQVSAASHYVFYLGEAYAGPLRQPRARWITPLGGLTAAGVPVAVHSDAPLAPPLPLRAASVQVTRATREGGTYVAEMALSPYQALEAITLDAAKVLGLEGELGSIAPAKKADLTILESDPLETAPEDWENIPVWGVVLGGVKRPIDGG
ncbi:MAG: amidohydrolase family protein [Hyphomonas sp.]|uniref:amidohydrolase n=1 Tax=Hyphomonas sp. TaxID=87 RepID=UPI00352748E8